MSVKVSNKQQQVEFAKSENCGIQDWSPERCYK